MDHIYFKIFKSKRNCRSIMDTVRNYSIFRIRNSAKFIPVARCANATNIMPVLYSVNILFLVYLFLLCILKCFHVLAYKCPQTLSNGNEVVLFIMHFKSDKNIEKVSKIYIKILYLFFLIL
jgi:hypothetical protein